MKSIVKTLIMFMLPLGFLRLTACSSGGGNGSAATAGDAAWADSENIRLGLGANYHVFVGEPAAASQASINQMNGPTLSQVRVLLINYRQRVEDALAYASSTSGQVSFMTNNPPGLPKHNLHSARKLISFIDARLLVTGPVTPAPRHGPHRHPHDFDRDHHRDSHDGDHRDNDHRDNDHRDDGHQDHH